MKRETNKSEAIRAILKASRGPIDIDTLRDKLERKLRQVIGRQALKDLVNMMSDEIEISGRADTRRYALVKGGA